MNCFSDALALQGRVLWALCLREIHGKNGKTKLGYIWELVKTGFGVAVFWWIREMAGFTPPSGMSTPIFLLMGFIPWYIFSQSVSLVMEAVRTNKALLTFPQITPLDLCLSSAIVVWVTEALVLVIYLAGISLFGYEVSLYKPFSLLSGIIGVAFFGLGVGLSLASLNYYLPAIEKLVPMALRILFFTSGVFFSPAQLSARFGEYIMWLPTANFIELLRNAFVNQPQSGLVRGGYVACFTVAFLALGLLLERYVRPLQGTA